MRQQFEGSLGVDLSSLLLHTGEESAAAADAMGARAFADGNDIHFGSGQYAPDDPFGMHLIAHEVAHTVQQREGRTSGPQLKKAGEAGGGGDAAEDAADKAADAMVAGQPAPKNLSPALMKTLTAEHEARRAKHDKAVDGVATSVSIDELTAALAGPAALFGVSTKDLSGFLAPTAWGEAELRLQLDVIGPELQKDARLEKEKATAADALGAAATLAAGYEPLFKRCAAAARTADDLRFREKFVGKDGFEPIVGVAFGGATALTPVKLNELFSATQKKLLSEFMSDKKLPDGLFTGAGATGAVSPQQRVLMASHMMVVGKVEQREKDGEHTGVYKKGRADNCGHWATLAWAYAGVTPASDFAGNNNLKTSTTGPTGEVSFGGGSSKEVYKGAVDPSLQLEDRHADYIKKHPELAGTGEAKRLKTLGPELFGMLEPGDWIWIYNGNASGQHSQIFAGWVDTSDQHATDAKNGAITYRTCKVFHQYDNEKGLSGHHTHKLGFPFSFDHKVFPVTMVKRAGADAGAAHSIEKLLPFNVGTAVAKNREAIGKFKLDAGKLAAQAATSARAALASLKSLDPDQAQLCQQVLTKHEAGATLEDLSWLVALAQRVMRETNVNGVLVFYNAGPDPATKSILGKRPMTDFK